MTPTIPIHDRPDGKVEANSSLGDLTEEQERSLVTPDRIPPECYGADDGDTMWIPGGTREQARATAANFWGDDYINLHPYRVYLRLMSDQEKIDRYGERAQDYSECVRESTKDDPRAVPGWRVESH